MHVFFCLTLQCVCTAVGVECIQIVIWENTNFFSGISDRHIKGKVILQYAIQPCCVLQYLCFVLSAEFLVSYIEIKGLCVQRISAKPYNIASYYGRK
jgi:hypothetical protein